MTEQDVLIQYLRRELHNAEALLAEWERYRRFLENCGVRCLPEKWDEYLYRG